VESDVDAVIDTGFDDQLILPASMIALLGLTVRSTGVAQLADGSFKTFQIFAASVE